MASNCAPAPLRLQEAANRLASEHGLRHPVTVWQSGECEAPMLLGLTRPTIVFPSSLSGLPADQAEALLAHEIAHLCRKDWLFSLLAIVSCVLNYFNPFVWWAHWRLVRAREASADQWVLRHGGCTAGAYCRGLLAVAESLTQAQPAYLAAGRRSSELPHSPRL